MLNLSSIVRPFSAILAVMLLSSALAASPARADDGLPPLKPVERVAHLDFPYERCGIVTCTLYLDRSTSKHFANRFGAVGLTNDRVVDVGGELLCATFGAKIGGACGLLDALIGDSLAEAVKQAEEIDGCVTFKYLAHSSVVNTHDLSATNSKYCRD